MDLVTPKEFAELEKTTYESVKKNIQRGNIKYSEVNGIGGQGGKQYRIPVTELSQDAQIKYYRKKLKENQHLIPDDLKPKEVDKSNWKNFKDFSADEREEIVYWIRILEDWQIFRNSGEDKKTILDKKFIENWNATNKEHILSVATLRRRYKLWQEKGDQALCENRGKSNKGRSKVDEVTWAIFQQYYLTEHKRDASTCYDLTYEVLLRDRPDLLPMASLKTFTRKIKTIPYTHIQLGRYGEKALKDKALPYIVRDYTTLKSNSIWVADNHTLDIMVKENDGSIKPHRIYLTAYQDVRSRKIVGRYATKTPNSDSNIICLKGAVTENGLPDEIYTDNGREFLVHDIGGRGRRKTSNTYQVPTILERLDIQFTNALVYNGRAKGIERAFREVKNNFCKMFDTYTGGHVLERPESLKNTLKNMDNVINEDELTNYLYDYIDYIYNEQPQNGNGMNGKSPNQVYAENMDVLRTATNEDLELMLLRSTKPQKVKRIGVAFKMYGQELVYRNSYLIQNYQGQQVYLRYDPENLGKVRVYDLEDRFICEAENKKALEYGADKETLKEAMREQRNEFKNAKQGISSIASIYDAPDAIEMQLEKIERRKINATNTKTNVISIHKADEQEYNPILKQASGSEYEPEFEIDIGKMVKNLKKKKGL